jgi:hypothetical protein
MTRITPRPIPVAELSLPRPDLSAREAVTLIRPHAKDAEPDWRGCMINSEACADRDGRLTLGMGSWLVGYRSASGSIIRATLGTTGHLFTQKSASLVEPPPLFALDSEWLDSTVVAEIVGREPLVEGMQENYNLHLNLQSVADIGLFWQITRGFFNQTAKHSISHSFGVDARSGDVTLEWLERSDHQTGKKHKSRRDRLNGGDWTPV